MIHPIGGGGTFSAAPVARVRRKVMVRGQAIEHNAAPEELDGPDGATVAILPAPPSGDPTGSSQNVGPGVLEALLRLHHGG